MRRDAGGAREAARLGLASAVLYPHVPSEMLLIDLRRDLFSVQGGADPSTKHQVYWNEYSDLDDSPVSWHITEVSARYLLSEGPES
jgi:hypothetical protein